MATLKVTKASSPNVVMAKPAATPKVTVAKPASTPNVVMAKPAATPNVVMAKPAATPSLKVTTTPGTATTTAKTSFTGKDGGTYYVGGASTSAAKSSGGGGSSKSSTKAQSNLPYETGSLAGDLARAAALTRQAAPSAFGGAAAPGIVTPPTIQAPPPQAQQQFQVQAPSTVDVNALTGETIMTGNVQAIADQINRDYIAAQKALQTPKAQLRAMERRNQLASELRGLQTEQVLRETGIREAPSEVGQAIVGRQINALNRYIATRQLPLINEIQAQTDIIATYQEQQAQLLKQLELTMDQGKFNLGLAKEYENRKYQEQQEVKKLAQTLGVTSRYLEVNGEVKDTATGEKLSLAEFQRRTGQQVGAPESATDFSMVQSYQNAFDSATQREIVNDFITKYPEARISPTDSLEAAQNKIARAKQKAGGDGAGAVAGPASPVVQAYTDAVLAGTLDITNVPAAQRNGVILEMQRRAQSGAQGTVAVTDPRQAEIRFAYYAQQLPQLITNNKALDDPFAQAEQLKVELPTVDPKKIDAMVYTSYGVPENVWKIKEPKTPKEPLTLQKAKEKGLAVPAGTEGLADIGLGIINFFR